jgi:hypothetical protein
MRRRRQDDEQVDRVVNEQAGQEPNEKGITSAFGLDRRDRKNHEDDRRRNEGDHYDQNDSGGMAKVRHL